MKVEDFSFEQRSSTELPTSGLSQWLADFNGDDQWYEEGNHGTKAAVVLGDHIIVWQDGPLTDEDKRNAIAEYQGALETDAEEENERDHCEHADTEDTAHDWLREGF